MSRFDHQFQQAGRHLLIDNLGNTTQASYKLGTADATNVTGIFTEDHREIQDGADGRQNAREARLIISRADIAAPSIRATITANSETWDIVQIDLTESMATLHLERRSAIRKSIEGSRRVR